MVSIHIRPFQRSLVPAFGYYVFLFLYVLYMGDSKQLSIGQDVNNDNRQSRKSERIDCS